MAQDIADLLSALALQRANVLGHDSARVAYRFALDHPKRINKLGIIEIVPTADFWASWTVIGYCGLSLDVLLNPPATGADDRG